MKTITGTSNRYLDINLTERTFTVYTPSEEDLRMYIGGKGIGLKIYNDRLGSRLADVDPLGEENILCFTMGLFIATGAPCSARFEGVTKSPLTGIMVGCSCGGPFGYACKTAGWDGVIIQGKSETPVSIMINESGVTFEDASPLWGQNTHETQTLLGMSVKDGALVIGQAGENKVRYANICSGHRFLGRGGMGAVMGSKNLKAIVAQGMVYDIIPADLNTFNKANEKAAKHIIRNGFSKSYRMYGTNYGVLPGIKKGYAPVYNFRDRTDDRCAALSGEAMAERYHTEHSTCIPCSVLCGHKGTYPDGKSRPIPEYETIGLWGGNIGNFDPDKVGYWNELLNNYGMDTISCGATVSWAMEANAKGIRPSQLQFDHFDNIEKVIEDIAYRRGEGDELAEGSKRLSEKYGGRDFAVQVKGMEMAAYDPRGGWGQALNYAVANRGGCHLNSYPIALEALFNFIPQYTTISKAVWVNFFEDFYSAINATQTCQFTAFGYLLEPFIAKYTPKPLLKMAMTLMPRIAILVLDWSALTGLISGITGKKISTRNFYKAGRRIHILERYMNTKMGISSKDDILPDRFTKEFDTKHPVKKAVNLAPMIKKYYRLKGYSSDGIPLPKTLKKFGIPQ